MEEICADHHPTVPQCGVSMGTTGLALRSRVAGAWPLSHRACCHGGDTGLSAEAGQTPQETRADPGRVDAQTRSEGTMELPLTCSDYHKGTRLKCPTRVILSGPPGTGRPHWLKQWQTKPTATSLRVTSSEHTLGSPGTRPQLQGKVAHGQRTWPIRHGY